MTDFQTISQELKAGNKRSLARCISLVENDVPGYEQLLQQLTFEKKTPWKRGEKILLI